MSRDVTAVEGDVSNLANLDRPIASVKELKGRIDILFRERGYRGRRSAWCNQQELFDRTFGANVKGALFTVQKALPLLP